MYGFKILCEISKVPFEISKFLTQSPQNMHFSGIFFVILISLKCDVISCSQTPLFFRITSLALGQSHDCPSASKDPEEYARMCPIGPQTWQLSSRLHIFNSIVLYEKCCFHISLEFVSKDPIVDEPVLVHIMAWHWTGSKPLSEPMMA